MLPNRNPSIIDQTDKDFQLRFYRLMTCLKTRKKQTIEEAWDSDVQLRDLLCGKQVQIGVDSLGAPIMLVMPLDETIDHFKSVLRSRNKKVIETIWDENALLRDVLCGKLIQIDSVIYEVPSEILIDFFKSASHAKVITRVPEDMWNGSSVIREQCPQPKSALRPPRLSYIDFIKEHLPQRYGKNRVVLSVLLFQHSKDWTDKQIKEGAMAFSGVMHDWGIQSFHKIKGEQSYEANIFDCKKYDDAWAAQHPECTPETALFEVNSNDFHISALTTDELEEDVPPQMRKRPYEFDPAPRPQKKQKTDSRTLPQYSQYCSVFLLDENKWGTQAIENIEGSSQYKESLSNPEQYGEAWEKHHSRQTQSTPSSENYLISGHESNTEITLNANRHSATVSSNSMFQTDNNDSSSQSFTSLRYG